MHSKRDIFHKIPSSWWFVSMNNEFIYQSSDNKCNAMWGIQENVNFTLLCLFLTYPYGFSHIRLLIYLYLYIDMLKNDADTWIVHCFYWLCLSALRKSFSKSWFSTRLPWMIALNMLSTFWGKALLFFKILHGNA